MLDISTNILKQMYFNRFYWIFFVLGLIIPINISVEYWNESLLNSFLILGIVRLMITTNISWLVNSAKLIWGLKKEDKLISVFNSVSLLYKLFFKIPKSHATICIDADGIRFD